MKKILFLLVLFLILFLGFKTIKNKVKQDLTQVVPYPSQVVTPTAVLMQANVGAQRKSLFVPYWALTNKAIDVMDYDQLIYFGITPSDSGIDEKEPGFKNINKFQKLAPIGKKKQLVLRMIDTTSNFSILKDQAKQNSLIKDSILIAKDFGFDGIVLDLEISAVPFDSLINQINKFTQNFYNETKKNKLQLSIMLYGDTFYRIRPFDVKTLAKNADKFMIMNYDFSKSRGNPGPNFPLKGKEVYGYDMTQMVDDYLRYIPASKISVVFGLFGYDWIVDDKGKAVSQGSAKTYQEIKKEFLGTCIYKDCVINRKNDSTETEISYTDAENKQHVVWFEDLESVEKKEKYLQQRGINNFSFWAYSYF